MKLSILLVVVGLVLLVGETVQAKKKPKQKPKGSCPVLPKSKYKIFKPYTKSEKGKYTDNHTLYN